MELHIEEHVRHLGRSLLNDSEQFRLIHPDHHPGVGADCDGGEEQRVRVDSFLRGSDLMLGELTDRTATIYVYLDSFIRSKIRSPYLYTTNMKYAHRKRNTHFSEMNKTRSDVFSGSAIAVGAQLP